MCNARDGPIRRGAVSALLYRPLPGARGRGKTSRPRRPATGLPARSPYARPARWCEEADQGGLVAEATDNTCFPPCQGALMPPNAEGAVRSALVESVSSIAPTAPSPAPSLRVTLLGGAAGSPDGTLLDPPRCHARPPTQPDPASAGQADAARRLATSPPFDRLDEALGGCLGTSQLHWLQLSGSGASRTTQ